VLSMKLGLAAGASTKAVWTRSGTASISTAGFTQYSDLNGNVRTITGSSISVSGSPILLISSATATSVSVSPSDPTIAAGGTQQFAATAYYSNGESGPVQASWKSSDPGVATISSSGLCTGAAAGITTLSATYMGLTASTSVIITAAGSGAAPPLPNPGFEQGAKYWAFNNSGSYSIVSGSAHSGNSYAVLNAPVGTHPVLFATGANGDQYFPVAAGDVIRFGGWVSRASGDGQGRYKLAIYDASRANPVYIDPTPSNVTGSSWTQQSGTYTVASGKSFVRIYCELFSNTVAASVAFDDVIFTTSPPAP
jgi:Bacterial Ig-like domain (group 2)